MDAPCARFAFTEVIFMSKIAILGQLEKLAERTAVHLDKKTDEATTKNYVRNVITKADGVEFVDGNGNVVYKIPAMA